MSYEAGRDSWREFFAELALTLDQTAVYVGAGNTQEARNRVEDARRLVVWARERLAAAATENVAFRPAEPEPEPLESQILLAIAPMIEALDSRNPQAKRNALDLLTRWLPRLQKEDGRFLGSHHRGLLYRWLEMGFAMDRAEWVITVARALVRIEDIGALPHLTRLARSAAVTAKGKRVKAEAEVCRVALESAKARSELNRTLLRSTDSPSPTLLRPAGNDEVDHPESLLRPTDQ